MCLAHLVDFMPLYFAHVSFDTLCSTYPRRAIASREAPYLYFSVPLFPLGRKGGPLAHKFAGEGGRGDNSMGQASPKKAPPCRAASDRKAKLPKFAQLSF